MTRTAPAAVLGVDGGNSKTEVVLASTDGTLLGTARGPGSSPHALGVDGAFKLLNRLVTEACRAAGAGADRPVAQAAVVFIAGADFPREVVELQAAADRLGWAPRTVVDNDTFALLRAGTDSPDAVAVVCGAGINCSGVRADGTHVRFPALGRISGDWGGGAELGDEALWAAAREEDGRGPHTALTAVVAGHYGLPSATAVTEAIHFGEADVARLVELAPAVLRAAADGDAVAVALVDRLADEVCLLAEAALRRLDLLDRDATVVLGGGVLASGDDGLLGRVRGRLAGSAPSAEVRVVTAPPVLGAALAAMDLVGAGADATNRLRAALARPASASVR